MFAKWLLEKIGGIAVGALLVGAAQWLQGLASGSQNTAALIVASILAAILGGIALLFGRKNPENQEIIELRTQLQEKIAAAAVRDGMVSKLESENARLWRQLGWGDE